MQVVSVGSVDIIKRSWNDIKRYSRQWICFDFARDQYRLFPKYCDSFTSWFCGHFFEYHITRLVGRHIIRYCYAYAFLHDMKFVLIYFFIHSKESRVCDTTGTQDDAIKSFVVECYFKNVLYEISSI